MASGLCVRTWSAESWPQSTRKLLEMPDPRCGSRITFTPLGESSRASSESSGCDSESPVTSSVFSGSLRAGGCLRSAGANASGVTGGTPVLVTATLANESTASSLSSGESHAVASCEAAASGSLSPSQPAGLPTARTSVSPGPEFICSPWRRIDGPSNRIRTNEQISTAMMPSRARKRRRPCWSNRLIRLSSSGISLEAEVDEGGDAVRGHRRTRKRDADRQPDAEDRSLDPLDAPLEALNPSGGQELQTGPGGDR